MTLRFALIAFACIASSFGCTQQDDPQLSAPMTMSPAAGQPSAAGAPSGTGLAPGSAGAPASNQTPGTDVMAAGANAPMTGGSAGTAGSTTPSDPSSDAGATPAADDAGSVPPAKQRLAISADFLNKTLSIVDIDKLHEGGKRADALVGTVDLSKYTPGPMSLNITPDGKTALVSISGGFLSAFVTVPPGAGTLLFVDIATRTVSDELYIGNSPMGIVFSKDGKHAFVGLYSETYFAMVDVENHSYQPIATGDGFNEELAIDDSGTVGIETFGPQGNARTFALADLPSGSLGQTFGLSGDAGGAAFFPGTKKAYLMQAPTALTANIGGHDVIDVSNPSSPVASDPIRISAPSMYAVTAVPARGSIAYPSYANNKVSVTEMKLDGDVAKEVQTIDAGEATNLAYGITPTSDGKVLIAVPGDHYVGVVDLETGKSFHVPWEVTMSGPTEIKVVP